MDARLHADLGRAVVDRLARRGGANSSLVVLVGVGRALALAEAAERAADDADVGDVDVAVDDERHGVARELGAQLVGGRAHLLDRLRARLGEQRRQLVAASAARRRRARARSRRADEVAADRRAARPAARAPARDEAPVARLDRRRARPARSTPGRCTAGRRTAARSARRRPAPGACAPGAGDGNGCSGEMWSPLARQPAEVGRARARPARGHQSARFGGTWTPTSGISRARLGDEPLACRRSSPASPTPARRASGAVVRARCASSASARRRWRSRPAPRRSSAGAGRSSGGSPPAGGRARRAPRRAPRAPRSRSSSRLADADEDPARERDPQLAGGADRLQPPRRVLGRRALVGDEVGVDRLEHQPLRGGHLAQPREVVARQHAEVRVRQQPALERALAAHTT